MTNKKKFCVIFFTLLLVALLGSFSTSFADSARTWTIEDLKNVVYNLAITKNSNETQVYNYIENNTANFMTMLNKINSSNQVTIALQNSSGGIVYIFCNNQSNMAKPYFYSNRMTRYGTSGQTTRYEFNCGNGTFLTETGAYAIETRYDLVQDKFYTSTPIYTSSGATTKKWDVGYSPSTLFEGRWVNITWEFNYPSNSFFYTLNNASTLFNQNYCGITSGYQIELGTIVDSSYITKITYNFASWQGSYYALGNWQTLYDKSRNGDILNYFRGSTTIQNNLYYTTLYLDTINQGNNILFVHIATDNDNLNDLYNYYYVINNNTSVVNGVIYSSNTFSGDYINQYQSQENTNNIINSNEKTTEDLINSITDFNSGDLAGLVEFPESTNVYDPTTNIFSYFLNRISTVFLNDSRQYLNLDLGYLGEFRLDSDFFRLYDFSPLLYLIVSSLLMIKFFIPKIDFIRNLVFTFNTADAEGFFQYSSTILNVRDIF